MTCHYMTNKLETHVASNEFAYTLEAASVKESGVETRRNIHAHFPIKKWSPKKTRLSGIASH